MVIENYLHLEKNLKADTVNHLFTRENKILITSFILGWF